MVSHNLSIIKPVRRLMIIVVLAIFAIIVSFAHLLYQSSVREGNSAIIINVFGRQRMLTQSIAKNTSQLYALIQASESEKSYTRPEDLRQQIAGIKKELDQSRLDFAVTLESMHSGVLYDGNQAINIRSSIEKSSGDLENIDKLWERFSYTIDIMVDARKITADVTNATNYINENNTELLHYCDSITRTVISNLQLETHLKNTLSVVLVILAFVIIVLALVQLSRTIVKPFSELYKGISEIGLSTMKVRSGIPKTKDLIPVVSEIRGIFNKIDYLISLIENINKKASFVETLEYINKTFTVVIPFTYIGIALVDSENGVIEASYGVSDGTISHLPGNLAGKHVPLEETSLGRLIHNGGSRIINDLEAYTADKPMKDYNQVVLESGIRSSIALPLKVSDEPIGIIFFSSNKKNVYSEEHAKFLQTIANSIAISIHKNIFVSDLLFSSVLALAKLAEARDEDTGEHLERMKTYSIAITKFLHESSSYRGKIDPNLIEDMERFSPMHDIGKVGIPDGILLKPGKLTFEEFEEMKKHTTYGAEVLRVAESNIAKRGRSMFAVGIEIAESHHEKWDGSGYPYGKKGLEIPLSARIVALADVFDALVSKRPYKEPFPVDVAWQIIMDGKGKHFDPDIVTAFEENKEQILQIYRRFTLKPASTISLEE